MNLNDKMTFEEAMLELEKTVSSMESGGLTLEESISAYERSMELVKICNTRISTAEQRVRILIESADGSVTDSSFDACDED